MATNKPETAWIRATQLSFKPAAGPDLSIKEIYICKKVCGRNFPEKKIFRKRSEKKI